MICVENRKKKRTCNSISSINQMFFIIESFRTIVFIFIAISKTFRPISSPVFEGVSCRTREPTRNFELRPSLNLRGSPVLILFAITGYKY